MGILKNICAVKTMRSMEEQFNEENCIDTLRILDGDRLKMKDSITRKTGKFSKQNSKLMNLKLSG